MPHIPKAAGSSHTEYSLYINSKTLKVIINQLIDKNEYNLETHKKLVIENLLDKKYDMEIINEWLDYL